MTKDDVVRRLREIEDEYADAMQWRDWTECELLLKERKQLQEVLKHHGGR